MQLPKSSIYSDQNPDNHSYALNPRYIPTIPAMPANAGGAGMGSFKNAKINPTKNPVNVAIKTVFITSPLF